jgi:DNA uptake protein ComE-like DNA-binding protein
VDGVKSASKEQLLQTPGITEANAAAIISFFAGSKTAGQSDS